LPLLSNSAIMVLELRILMS